MMSDPRREIEEEVENLQSVLKSLVSERIVLQEEFDRLTDLESNLNVQLREDTLAGEGQLHTFQYEKRRVEEQLNHLERQLAEKMDRMKLLDEKASEYLLKVTSDSNSVYDEEETSEANEVQRNLIEKLLYDDMMENQDFSDGHSESGSVGTDTENVTLDEQMEMADDDAESNLGTKPDLENSIPAVDVTRPEGDEGTLTPPTKEQMLCLTSLVTELKRVKEEMGQAVSTKESSFIDLEEQLQSTRKELAWLKVSMVTMADHLKEKEEDCMYEGSGRLSRQSNVSKKIADFIEMRRDESRSDDDHEDYIDRMEIIENSNLEMDDYLYEAVREARQGSKASQYRSPSIGSISERVAALEHDLSESNEALKQSKAYIKKLGKEKIHKQKESEILQEKVVLVECKMNELQGTFDALIKAIMAERDELLKETKQKENSIKEMEGKLENIEKNPPTSLTSTQIEEIEAPYRDDVELLHSQISVMKENHVAEKEELKLEKDSAINSLKEELKLSQVGTEELSDSVQTLKEEMVKFRKEITKVKEERDQLENRFKEEIENSNDNRQQLERKMQEQAETAQKEHEDLERKLKDEVKCSQDSKEQFERMYESLQKEKEERDQRETDDRMVSDVVIEASEVNAEILRQQIEDLMQQLEELNAKNLSQSAEMYTKDEEYAEELSAREGTIQELRITLTNNQKQSRENFQMAQDDVATLQMRLQKEDDENKAILTLLKEKVIKLEEDGQMKQQECDALKNKIDEMKKDTAKFSKEGEESNTAITSDLVDTEKAEHEDKMVKSDNDVQKHGDEAICQHVEKVNSDDNVSSPQANEEGNVIANSEVPISENLEGKITSSCTEQTSNEHFEEQFALKDVEIKLLSDKVLDLEKALSDKCVCMKLQENKLEGQENQGQEGHENQGQEGHEKLKFEGQENQENYETTKLTEQLEKIEELNKFIDELKSELLNSNKELSALKETINALKNTEQNKGEIEATPQEGSNIEEVQQEESNSIKEKESSNVSVTSIGAQGPIIIDKLTEDEDLSASADKMSAEKKVLEAELGEKKNFENTLELKLDAIESSLLDSACQVEKLSMLERVDRLRDIITIKLTKVCNCKLATGEKGEGDIKCDKILSISEGIVDDPKVATDLNVEKEKGKTKYSKEAKQAKSESDVKTVEGLEGSEHLGISNIDVAIEVTTLPDNKIKPKTICIDDDSLDLDGQSEESKMIITLLKEKVSNLEEVWQTKHKECDMLKDKMEVLKKERDHFKRDADLVDASKSNSIVKPALLPDEKMTAIEDNSGSEKSNIQQDMLEDKSKVSSAETKDGDYHISSSVDTIDHQGSSAEAAGKLSIEPDEASEKSSGSVGESAEELAVKLRKVENHNKKLVAEKKRISKEYEIEQVKVLDMQNQMVNDLESLILNLEAEKKDLSSLLDKALKKEEEPCMEEAEKTLHSLQESLSLVEKERDVLRQELLKRDGAETDDGSANADVQALQFLSLTKELGDKINALENQLKEAEKRSSEELEGERLRHNEQMKQIRKDVREEIDILEQQKEDVEKDLSRDMEKIASDWAGRLEETSKELSSSAIEEKAQFGRVLVAKNNEFEKLEEERSAEVESYKARIKLLQKKLEDKTNIIAELETNMGELVMVRSNLEETIESLKTMKESTPKTTKEPLKYAQDSQKVEGAKPKTKSEDNGGAKKKKKRVVSDYEHNLLAAQMAISNEPLTPRGSGASSPMSRPISRGSGGLSPDSYRGSGSSSPHSYSPRPSKPRKPIAQMSFPPVKTSCPSWPIHTPFQD